LSLSQLSPDEQNTVTPDFLPARSIKLGEKVPATPTLSASSDLTPEEEQTILQQARHLVTDNSAGDITFSLSIKKKIPGFVRLEAIATNQTLDPLTIIFEKKNNAWTFVNMGTAFPDLETQIPELFKEE
jgi:hypothetical protein